MAALFQVKVMVLWVAEITVPVVHAEFCAGNVSTVADGFGVGLLLLPQPPIITEVNAVNIMARYFLIALLFYIIFLNLLMILSVYKVLIARLINQVVQCQTGWLIADCRLLLP